MSTRHQPHDKSPGHGSLGAARALARALAGMIVMLPLTAPAQWSGDRDDFRDKLLLMGTGPDGGSYSPLGNAVCNMLNAHRQATLVRCVPVPSAGAVFNIHAVANGLLQLGIAQEDLVFKAASEAVREDGRALRIVALLHESSIGIMVRKAAGITELGQLRNAVVNVGNLGSATSADADTLLKALELDNSKLKGATRYTPDVYVKAFCDGQIDVVINSVAHPAEQFQRLRQCGGEFLEIPAAISQRMMAINPMLRPMRIEAGVYDGAQKPVSTLGIRNFLISRAGVDGEAIFRLVTKLQTNLGAMQASEKTMGTVRMLKPSDLDRLPVPAHPGTLRALDAGVH